MDYLTERDNFDIQWGNHDALWMGLPQETTAA